MLASWRVCQPSASRALAHLDPRCPNHQIKNNFTAPHKANFPFARSTTTNHPQYITKPTRWADFTATERAFLPPPSLTPALLPRGSRPPPSRSLSRSPSWPERVPLPRRLVSSSVTPTALPRSSWSPVCGLRVRDEKAHY